MKQTQEKIQSVKSIIEKDLIDPSTGEVERYVFKVEKKIKRKPKQTKVVDQYIRVFHESILKSFYDDKLDYNEMSLLLTLCLFIDWQSTIIVDRRGIPFSINKLSKELNKNRTWLTNILNNLNQKGFIVLETNGNHSTISVMPFVAWKGNVD